jgi:formylglycine-generating enzyme required for sulfatase activity
MTLAFGLLVSGAAQETPVLESVRLKPCLMIQGEVGTTNEVLYADELAPDQWRVLTNVVVTNSSYEVVDTGARPGWRSYLVALAPDPNEPTVHPNRWVWIPPGTFTMGSPDTEKHRDSDEGPQTTVTLTKGFWMGKYEVARGEYVALIKPNPWCFKCDLNLPVEMVNWIDATNYCDKLTEQERQAGRLPRGWEYRLPTEAEWEYACRAGTTTRFSYGDDLNCSQLGNYAWYSDNSGWDTHPVGEKLPNPWGLYDMHGNVAEWCLDWYGTYPGGNVTDPVGPRSGSYRVIRSGWEWFPADACRSAERYIYRGAGDCDYGLGFRVVLAPGQ